MRNISKLVQFCEYFDLVTDFVVVVVAALPRAVPILIAHLNIIERQKLQKKKLLLLLVK